VSCAGKLTEQNSDGLRGRSRHPVGWNCRCWIRYFNLEARLSAVDSGERHQSPGKVAMLTSNATRTRFDLRLIQSRSLASMSIASAMIVAGPWGLTRFGRRYPGMRWLRACQCDLRRCRPVMRRYQNRASRYGEIPGRAGWPSGWVATHRGGARATGSGGVAIPGCVSCWERDCPEPERPPRLTEARDPVQDGDLIPTARSTDPTAPA
jgi:hypothetical protein